MGREKFDLIERAVRLAIERIISKGCDDVFKPPTFSHSIELRLLTEYADDFRRDARGRTIAFLKAANLDKERVGPPRRSLVVKDINSFRGCAWFDPFDAVKYLAAAYMLFGQIEKSRIPKGENVIHSHRLSDGVDEIFDSNFGYDSFRSQSSLLSGERIGQWKVITDISNFFDRIGNHTLENNLTQIGCDPTYVSLISEMLFFWAGDRRSFGVPVGSDASRILSEATLIQVDRKLRDADVTFVRYVDDFRIFSETRAKALKAIELLTDLLAEEGFQLNSKKTEILKIVNSEEISQLTNRFHVGEHRKIDLNEKIIVEQPVRISGRSTISRFYREPGREAIRKISLISKDKIFEMFVSAADHEVEQQIKLVVKYFIYVDSDIELLESLVDRRITSIFYIADALVKESDRFDSALCIAIRDRLFRVVDWMDCAYPLQVPILRIAGHPSFLEPSFVCKIVDRQLQTDNMIFYREAISLGYLGLDRLRLKKLATSIYGDMPNYVRRAIFFAVKAHGGITDDEKRPLLKNMKKYDDDWFIGRM